MAIILEGKGHSTYILGRDLQKWQDFTHPMMHKMRTIAGRIKSADAVFAYVNSSVFSKGLLMEMVFAKLFGKPIVMAVRHSVKPSFIEKFANRILRYSNVNEIEKVEIPA